MSHYYLKQKKLDYIAKDYELAKGNWKEHGIQNVSEFRNFHVQSDTLLLTDLFKSVQRKCIKLYKPDPVHFIQH